MELLEWKEWYFGRKEWVRVIAGKRMGRRFRTRGANHLGNVWR